MTRIKTYMYLRLPVDGEAEETFCKETLDIMHSWQDLTEQEQEAFLDKSDELARVLETVDCGCDIIPVWLTPRTLALRLDDWGNPDQVAAFCHVFLKHFNKSGCLATTWSEHQEDNVEQCTDSGGYILATKSSFVVQAVESTMRAAAEGAGLEIINEREPG